MKKIFKHLIGGAFMLSLLIGFNSCGNKDYSKLTPEQQEIEYAQFQKDSIRLCTQDKRMAEAAVMGAFDRVPENNGYWKKDDIKVEYNDSLKCWVGTVEYHYDRNNTYYKTYKTFYVKYWYENNGFAKDAKLNYVVSE